MRQVGVVSLLGNTFHGISIGFTIFNNKYFAADVADWRIDAFTSEMMAGRLRQSSGIKVAELDRMGQPAETLLEDSHRRLLDMAAQQGFDTLVVARPGVNREANPFFQPAFGFYERTSFAGGLRCVYAAFVVQVYDVATKESFG